MDFKNILLIVFIIVLLYLLVVYMTKNKNTLSGMMNAQTMQTIPASSLDNSNTTSSTSNFTYSIWFFIDNWNYRYGESKVIYGRMSSSDGNTLTPCPLVSLGAIDNDINISLQVYPGTNSINSISPNTSTGTIDSSTSNFTVSNIPLQKWVNLLISAYGRSLDVYIDGKLTRTFLLPGVAKVDTSTNVYVTPQGGFSGWTSLFQYWPNATDPQTAWNIYKAGYGGSIFGNFGKYSIKLALMEGQKEDVSIQI
jgi:hypothetical protein